MEDLLLRAALLSGLGARAQPMARRLAASTVAGSARSCLEAGAPIQLTIDAPGEVGLRVGMRLGPRLVEAPLRGLVPDRPRAHLVRLLAPLPPDDHPSLGAWLFWTQTRQSIFVDLRDPEPRAALDRLRTVLPPAAASRLRPLLPRLTGAARPWALRLEADDDGPRRLHLYWLMSDHDQARRFAEELLPGSWPRVRSLLGHLLRAPGRSGRFVIVTPLDERTPPGLRLVNTGWTLVPEDDDKRRALGALVHAQGGQRDHAEALWSLCRSTAGPRWRVGRACELRLGEVEARVRVYMTPSVDASPPPADATLDPASS